MDNILFVHDHRFYMDSKGLFYSEGKLPFSAFKGYLGIAKRVDIVCRSVPSCSGDSLVGLVLTSAENVTCLPVKGRSWKEILGRNLIRNLFCVWRSVKRADLVILRLPSILSLLVFPMLMFSRTPYAVEVVGDGYEAIKTSGKYSGYAPLALIYEQCMRVMIKLAVGAIYVTSHTLQRKYRPPKIYTHASNVTIAPVSKIVLKRRAEKINSLTTSPARVMKVGIVGSFNNNYKGIDVLISSIFLVREKFNVELFIVGTGDDAQFKDVIDEYKAASWVHFQGRFSKEKLMEWFDEMDLYCQPSRTEGLPRALIEAMSRGCPALATDVGGIPELLDSACLVRVDDVAELAHKISWMFGSTVIMADNSEKNFYKATSYYLDILERRRAQFWQQVKEKVSSG